MKTVFTYAHVKWFYGQPERVLFELFYKTLYEITLNITAWYNTTKVP